MGDDDILQLYQHTLDLLTRNALVVEEKRDNARPVWGLDRKALRLSCRVDMLKCSQCGRVLTVDEEESPIWIDAPCIREACGGRYGRVGKKTNFYADLYANGDIHRLFTAEHTGLLDREEREKTESSFKREGGSGEDRRMPWDYNLLSCTPTLEMGIDIGSLSTTIQCSVPPAQANYLQRTGRAGRKNGNALSVTIACAHAHDLYFYALPEQMMCGEINPPGIFLNAAAVLERQLTAFCIDRWTAQDKKDVGIPDKMEKVLNTQSSIRKNTLTDEELRGLFPYNLFAFIENNASVLYRDFVSLFPQMETETAASLQRFIMGDSGGIPPLFSRMLAAISREEQEATSYEKRRNKLRRIRTEYNKKIKQGISDELLLQEQKVLDREISALAELYKKTLKRPPLEFLAEESFLPNYAFPENGVTLHSVIYKKQTINTAKPARYETQEFTYQRSASSALSELAPGSTFYAGKRRVTITKVDLTTSNWNAPSNDANLDKESSNDCIEPWRMCPDCSYMELNRADSASAPCPRCGSELFADAGQVYNLLRVSQVFANTNDKKSRIDDSADSRTNIPYVKNLLMDYERQDCKRIMRLDTDETTFAFAYIGKATFREINFGKPAATEQVSVAGKHVPRAGFTICKYCGCVLSDRQNEQAKPLSQHDWGCKGTNLSNEETKLEILYLYRFFESEAIKILLPFSSGERSFQLESFIAVFNMGMKLKFGGTLQHLQTMLHTEPDRLGNGLKRHFLVVYDSVPGGTGYLKQLLEGSTLVDILEIALKHLENCDCEGVPDHDGCYACLRAYKNSSRSSYISKHIAIDILRPIVKNKTTLKEIASLDDISITSNFESELEEHFIEALRRSGTPYRPVSLKNELIHGKTGFFLTIGQRHWLIEQQVELGPEQGVCVSSRADFLLSPARTTEGIRPVVLFTDGWMWHKDRIGKDMEQRTALLQSDKYLVWSLTWEDVEHVLNPSSSSNDVPKDVPEYVEPVWDNHVHDLFEKLCGTPQFSAKKMAPRVTSKNSMDLLLDYLADPDEKKYTTLLTLYVLISASCNKTERAKYMKALDALQGDKSIFERYAAPEDLFLQSLQGDEVFSRYYGVFGTKTKPQALAFLHYADDTAGAGDEQSFRKTWKGLLRALNLFQFLPLCVAYCNSSSSIPYMTMQQNRQNTYDSPHEKTKVSPNEEEWQNAAALLYIPGEQELLARIHELGLSVPEIGYPLMDADNFVQGELEMAWPSNTVGITAPDDETSGAVAQALGWKILPYALAVEHPEKLSELFGE